MYNFCHKMKFVLAFITKVVPMATPRDANATYTGLAKICLLSPIVTYLSYNLNVSSPFIIPPPP